MPRGIYTRTKPVWNKGLTKNDHEGIARGGRKITAMQKGRHHSLETKKKMSLVHLGAKYPNAKYPYRKKQSQEAREKRSRMMKLFHASLTPEQRALRTKHVIEGTHKRPTRFEFQLGVLIDSACPNEYKYVGDGSVILNKIGRAHV